MGPRGSDPIGICDPPYVLAGARSCRRFTSVDVDFFAFYYDERHIDGSCEIDLRARMKISSSLKLRVISTGSELLCPHVLI